MLDRNSSRSHVLESFMFFSSNMIVSFMICPYNGSKICVQNRDKVLWFIDFIYDQSQTVEIKKIENATKLFFT
jgi:hypothetical protein